MLVLYLRTVNIPFSILFPGYIMLPYQTLGLLSIFVSITTGQEDCITVSSIEDYSLIGHTYKEHPGNLLWLVSSHVTRTQTVTASITSFPPKPASWTTWLDLYIFWNLSLPPVLFILTTRPVPRDHAWVTGRVKTRGSAWMWRERLDLNVNVSMTTQEIRVKVNITNIGNEPVHGQLYFQIVCAPESIQANRSCQTANKAMKFVFRCKNQYYVWVISSPCHKLKSVVALLSFSSFWCGAYLRSKNIKMIIRTPDYPIGTTTIINAQLKTTILGLFPDRRQVPSSKRNRESFFV